MRAVEEARAEAADTDVRLPPLRLDQCDHRLLASALYAPQTSFAGIEKYPDLSSKAAALLYALAKSQACADGNKRLALILLLEFLALNGATLNTTNDDLADMIVETAETQAAARDHVVEQLTDRLGQIIVPLTMEDGQ